MAVCKYCNESAGFFKKYHPECQLRYFKGESEIKKILTQGLLNESLTEEIKTQIDDICKRSFVSPSEKKSYIISVWEIAVNNFLEDSAISKDEEDKLEKYIEFFGLEQNELDRNGYYFKMIKGAILYELATGKIPQRVNLGGVPLSINFDKEEKIIWVFQHVGLYQEKTQRHYEGGSQGVSVKIMKGVYYRTSAFKGRPVDTTYLSQIASGVLAITDKNLYYSSQEKSFKLPYKKIVSTFQYQDGIQIHKDGANSKPMIFLTNDGWFTNNLIENLIQTN